MLLKRNFTCNLLFYFFIYYITHFFIVNKIILKFHLTVKLSNHLDLRSLILFCFFIIVTLVFSSSYNHPYKHRTFFEGGKKIFSLKISFLKQLLVQFQCSMFMRMVIFSTKHQYKRAFLSCCLKVRIKMAKQTYNNHT